VQEAIVRAYHLRERYDPDRGALRGWVFRMAASPGARRDGAFAPAAVS
jgi:hypothetical protein